MLRAWRSLRLNGAAAAHAPHAAQRPPPPKKGTYEAYCAAVERKKHGGLRLTDPNGNLLPCCVVMVVFYSFTAYGIYLCSPTVYNMFFRTEV